MKADPRGWIDAFPGASLACFFGRPWSEAGLSVAAAAHRLGMLPVTVRPAEARLGSSKPVDDTARILVVNAWSPDHDPCQVGVTVPGRSVEDSSFRLGSRPRIARTPADSPAALQVAVHLAETPIYLVVAALLLVAAGFTLVGTVVDIVEGSNSRTISDIRRSSRWSRSANASSPGS